MQSSRQIELITIPILAFFFMTTPALAQEQPAAQAVDPLTGQVTAIEADEPVEQPPDADLTEANALVAESDYAGAEALLAGR